MDSSGLGLGPVAGSVNTMNLQVLFRVGNFCIVCMAISHSDRTVSHAVSYNLLTIFAWRTIVGQSSSLLQAF